MHLERMQSFRTQLLDTNELAYSIEQNYEAERFETFVDDPGTQFLLQPPSNILCNMRPDT
jgi:hypothetical protein